MKQLSNSAPEAIHVVVGDGAGFHHKSADESLPSNIRIIKLPAYRPELNPAEKFWDIVKDGICNKFWEDLDSVEHAITKKSDYIGKTQTRSSNLLAQATFSQN